jgi:hypothetical protein
MDTGSFADASFPAGVPEEGAMSDSRLVRCNTSVAFVRIPTKIFQH